MSFAKQRVTGPFQADTPTFWWFMRADEEAIPVRVRVLHTHEGPRWIAEGEFHAGQPGFTIPLPTDLRAGTFVSLSLVDPKDLGCFLEPAAPSQAALIFGRFRLRPAPPSGIPRFPTKTVPE